MSVPTWCAELVPNPSLGECNLTYLWGLGARYSPQVDNHRRWTAPALTPTLRTGSSSRLDESSVPLTLNQSFITVYIHIYIQKCSLNEMSDQRVSLGLFSFTRLSLADSWDSPLSLKLLLLRVLPPSAVATYLWWAPQHRPLCVTSVLTLTLSTH